MQNFFFKSRDENTFHVGSDTFAGQCKRSPGAMDTKDMVPYFTPEDRERKMIEMIAGCGRMKPKAEDKRYPSCIVKVAQIFAATGYGKMARNIIERILPKGINLQCFSTVNDTMDFSIERVLDFFEKTSYEKDVSGPLIYMSTFCRESKRHTVFFTMSEYDDHPNGHHTKILDLCDEIWVPTEWNKQILNRVVNKDIHVFNLGVDSNFFSRKRGSNVIFSSGTNKFIFLCIGTFIWRKGFDCLIKAYNKAFSSNDDVTLLFISKGAFPGSDKMIDLYIEKMREYCSDNSAHIAISSSIIPEDAMPYVYSSANAYAMLTRGEGWGLPYIEAAACGVPIIGSYHGGQKTFLNQEDSFLVTPDMFSYAPQYYIDTVKMYQDVRFADFSEKAIDETAEKMRYVYENYNRALELAEKARARITRDFTWDRTADLVYNRIIELQK